MRITSQDIRQIDKVYRLQLTTTREDVVIERHFKSEPEAASWARALTNLLNGPEPKPDVVDSLDSFDPDRSAM